jgi:hypothetical protein
MFECPRNPVPKYLSCISKALILTGLFGQGRRAQTPSRLQNRKCTIGEKIPENKATRFLKRLTCTGIRTYMKSKIVVVDSMSLGGKNMTDANHVGTAMQNTDGGTLLEL